jgi:MFS family permease
MGLNKDLSLQANEFSNAATIFFAAYLIAEIPTGELCFTSGGENATDLRSSDIVYILTKVSAGKWLGINVMLWGIATACTAAATNYTTLLVARIFLGICEAPVVPTLTLVSSQWYTKSEQGPRFAFWYCGLGFGQVIRIPACDKYDIPRLEDDVCCTRLCHSRSRNGNLFLDPGLTIDRKIPHRIGES